MSLDFLCYAGIGDIAWVYSKLIDVAKQRPVSIGIEDHELRRASDFVDMLPHVKNLGYIRPPKKRLIYNISQAGFLRINAG